MTIQEDLAYRKKVCDDAIRMKKMERVPHISNFALWPVLDYGVPLSAACRDWDLMEKVQRAFYEKYPFDCTGNLGAFFCNPPRMLDDIGPGFNIFDDEKGAVYLDDVVLMQPEDYDDLIADYPKLVWEKFLPRKFDRWSEVTVGDFKTAIDEFARFGGFLERISRIMIEEYGLPAQFGSMISFPGIELLYNNLRGIKGTSYDMRKIPDKVAAAVKHFDVSEDSAFNIFTSSMLSDASAFGTMTVLLAHNFLSLDQWEKYLWPGLKRMIDAAIRADTTVYIFAEGVISRFYDYFKDIPAGYVCIQIEQDDVFDFKANLPNICVSGGMSTALLGGGTEKQCVDYAKHLCDELGKEGGFMLCQDKMMSYMRDAKPENLKAVAEFVTNYRL